MGSDCWHLPSEIYFMIEQGKYLKNLFGVTNQVAVVTGGLGKLGAEYVEALVQAGAKVAILDVVEQPSLHLKKIAEKYPVIFLRVNIKNEKEISDALKLIEKRWRKPPSILVNNAGWKASPNDPKGAGVPFEKYPMDLWDEVFSVNIAAAAKCAKIFGGRMIDKKIKGSIINIASHYALVSADQRIYQYREAKGKSKFIKDAAYGSSKAALIALTRDLATLWAPHGIRVNAIALGGVLNPKSDQEFIINYCQRVPLGRMAKPNEYNGAMLFLASEASSYLTGTTIVADGGWTAW